MKKLMILILGLVIIIMVSIALTWRQEQQIELASAQEAVEIPFLDEWSGSGHADAKAEAFIHWDEEDPAEVPVECAKCHSTPGHLDFLGADSSKADQVDQAAPVGTVIECVACHNKATLSKDSVVMPSGVEISGLGREARCMECHQGRNSSIGVTETLSETAVAGEDTVSKDLGFLNIHYYAAAATKYGTIAKGGYQYEGKTYDAKFAHVDEFSTCIDCHDSHTLEVKVKECSTCHKDVKTAKDLKAIRMQGSQVDYDGDGNIKEGIYYEIEGLQKMLLKAIEAYAKEEAKKSIVYEAGTYPYFFIDTDKDGRPDKDEAAYPNRYDAWTPRLVKAAYNYQTSLKDPGAFAHGGKYIIQLLYDSIEDINTALSKPVNLAKAHRLDDGHFAGSEEPFRHWDEDGQVSAGCSKCHSAAGLPLFLKDEATISQPLANGFQCASCHDDLTEFSRYEAGEVEFPSGAIIDSKEPDTNLCMNCHQGRTSKVDVDEAIKGLKVDTPSKELGFLNIHYLAAGATRYGTEAQGAYEYEGKKYEGFYKHVSDYRQCSDCHSTHGLNVKAEECAECHDGAKTEEDLQDIREAEDDFDGDGNTKEGLALEIKTLQEALYAAMQDYASDVAKSKIIYDSHSYPYFFIDTNGNGKADPKETVRDNQYASWTPRLLKAAYNYQYSLKDPGAFTHNGPYIIQILYDSLEDLSEEIKVDMKDMTRP